MQKRLHALRADWSDATFAVQKAAATDVFPMSEVGTREQQVDQKYSGTYRQNLLPELDGQKAQLLQAVPGLHSYRDYAQVKTIDDLMNVE